MSAKSLQELRVKVFADGAEVANMLELDKNPLVKGFTTNPTLMKKAGVTDYAGFAKEVLAGITEKPVSFEVFSDDFGEMERQARIITAWGKNVYVKIPITNTKGESTFDLVKKLAEDGIQMNVTAIFTLAQVQHIIQALSKDVPAIISVFAGRIADTGVDPVPAMREIKAALVPYPKFELLWASSRELLNIYQAEEVGAEIITVTPDILKKTAMVGLNLDQLSLDTVKMFYDDGQKAGFTL